MSVQGFYGRVTLIITPSETVKRVLNLPDGTNIIWRSHDDSIAQRSAIDQARYEKNQQNHDKRRVISVDESQQREKPVTGS